ncbi:MAG: hypothetical protein L0Z50_04645 [Verrucomicrobiales bacterium]|nr:hypothetical protein [Verrucomicrobiales bacterium]
MTTLALAQGTKLLFENTFQKAAIGSVPEEFLVLDGGFVVKEEAGNKFLELPGAPLETFGVLFGPTEKENIVASARVLAAGQGRRFPTFGLGLGGQGGYRVQVAPAKKAIELCRGDTVKASVPYQWDSGKWTQLKIQVRKIKEGEWKVEGKVWSQDQPEPAAWMIVSDERGKLPDAEPRFALPSGRASIWGSPYAGTPIRFDDLVVARIP